MLSLNVFCEAFALVNTCICRFDFCDFRWRFWKAMGEYPNEQYSLPRSPNTVLTQESYAVEFHSTRNPYIDYEWKLQLKTFPVSKLHWDATCNDFRMHCDWVTIQHRQTFSYVNPLASSQIAFLSNFLNERLVIGFSVIEWNL